MFRTALIIPLILVLASCLPQPSTQAPDQQDVIGTLVAATLAAREQVSPASTATTAPVDDQTGQTDPAPVPASATPQPTASLTPTLSPTPTLTLTPTQTLTPTAVPGDPGEELGPPTWKDEFTSTANWNGFNDQQSRFEIKEGAFHLTAKKANNYEKWTISWPEVKNFYLEYTGVFGEECAGKDRYGMIFRTPDYSSGYLFGITCDGSYRLSAYDGEEYTVLRTWTKSEYIKSGPEAVNRFGAKVKNNKITLFINGREVFSQSVDLFPAKGKFGVFVAASETPGFTARLDRAAYWSLP